MILSSSESEESDPSENDVIKNRQTKNTKTKLGILNRPLDKIASRIGKKKTTKPFDDECVNDSDSGHLVSLKKTTVKRASQRVSSCGLPSSQMFTLTRESLMDLMENRNMKQFGNLSDVEDLVRALRSDSHKGLCDFGWSTSQDVDYMTIYKSPEHLLKTHSSSSKEVPNLEDRKEVYGRNVLPPAQSKSLFRLLIEAWNDKTLIFLSMASLISLATGIYEDVRDKSKIKWIEGFAILMAVIIVVTVTALNDYQKERNFRKLNAKKDDRLVKIVRNGEQGQISIFDVCVGDLVILASGDIICADGVLVEGRSLRCDESSMTGESDTVKKDLGHDIFILSGTKVLEGQGKMMVVAVGPYCLYGKTMMGLRIPNQPTPLQNKLAHLAEKVAILGLTASGLLLLILIIKYLVRSAIYGWSSGAQIANDVTHIFIEAITILVVAIPEGLPMAVTLALAYSSIQMLKDQNLVRVLASCETMGSATTICSDKTGTLTQNKMTVVSGYLSEMSFESFDGLKDFSKSLNYRVKMLLCESIAVNSTAFEDFNRKDGDRFIGSKTEIVLLEFLVKLEGPTYQDLRKYHEIYDVIPFSSDRKRMSTLINLEYGRKRLYCKGASEIVLKRCTKFLSMHGDPEYLTESKRCTFEDIILSYASDALRTICLAYRDFEANEIESLGTSWIDLVEYDLTCIGIVGIQDPLRSEVCDAVSNCQRAGIVVRMVTGDNMITARNIAKKCGILRKGGIIMEGAEFRNMSVERMARIIPNLQVLARSSPLDKQILVQRLRESGEIVAVTGDGTNDAPALKGADVGFSMGIAGTEVAKEASDIVLMDDNFSSIVKAVKWGRNVHGSVRKFLQFQLTVNITAVVVAFISATIDSKNGSVLTPIQLLWVNLIMDTFAALALGTEPPSDALLDQRPYSKGTPLISINMWKMIVGMSLFQILVAFILLYAWPIFFRLDVDNNLEHQQTIRTLVFNTFVFLQIFNEINCRRIDKKLNVFKGLRHHHYFLIIFTITVVAQVLIVEFGSVAFQTVRLPYYYWFLSIGIGASTLIIGVLIRLLPDPSFFGREEDQTPHEIITYEKWRWESAIGQVQTQLRVVNALRRRPY